MNIVNTLLRRYADRALQTRLDAVMRHNQRLRADVMYAETVLAMQRRQYRQMCARLTAQLADRDAEIAALKWELERRDDIEQDAAINRRNQAVEDYYADLDRDREGDWI